MSEQQVDIITRLVESGVFHLAETILSYLDPESLYKASVVSEGWRSIICEAGIWKKLIASLLKERNLSPIVLDDNQHDKIYYKLATAITELEERWRDGLFTRKEQKLELYDLETIQGFDKDTIIVFSTRDNSLRVLDSGTKECKKTFRGHDCTYLPCTQFDDRMIIISGARDGKIRVWDRSDPDGSQPCTTLDVDGEGEYSSNVARPYSYNKLKFNKNMMISYTDGRSGSINLIVWDIISPRDFRVRRRLDVKVEDSDICIDLHFDDKFIALGFRYGGVKVWDANTFGLLKHFDEHGEIRSWQYRDGFLVVAYGNQIKVWHVEKGQCVRTLRARNVDLVKFDKKHLMVVDRSRRFYQDRVRILHLEDVSNEVFPVGNMFCWSVYLTVDTDLHTVQLDDFRIRSSTARSICIFDFQDEPDSDMLPKSRLLFLEDDDDYNGDEYRHYSTDEPYWKRNPGRYPFDFDGTNYDIYGSNSSDNYEADW